MSGFDQLERQLRKQVSARRPRAKAFRGLTVGICVLVSAGTVTAAATGLIDRSVMSGSDRVSPVEKLLDDVARAADPTPGCDPALKFNGSARVSQLPPSNQTIRAFPTFRRPPTRRERSHTAAMKEAARRAGAVVMLAAGARELRATDGTRFLLIVASGATTDAVARDLDCLAARRRELDQRAAEVEPAVLAAARQSQNQENASIRKDLGRERLLLVYLTPDGRYAGLAGTSSDVAISAGTGSISKSAIDGLVPADVADVILRPRHGTASPIKIAVPEQVFHHELPKDFGRPIEVQWRASSGALLQTHQIGR